MIPALARKLVHEARPALALLALLAIVGAASAAERVVYLARGLPDEGLITLSAALAACDDSSVLLLDSDRASPYLKAFLTAYGPTRTVPVGDFAAGAADLERRLGVKTAASVTWTEGPPLALWRSLFARVEDVVVCPAEPRSQLLQAACLAGALRAPLFVVHGRKSETARLRKLLASWQTRRVHLVGKAHRLAPQLEGVEAVRLATETAVASAYQKQLAGGGRIETAVIANPEDTAEGLGGMSALAPWVALHKHAALLLTERAGTNVADVVDRAMRREALRHVETLIFVANLKAVPMWQRPNPIPADKDPHIEMEPLTPTGTKPFSFAVGRLFHDDPAVVPLMLARQRLLAQARGPRRALVASNPGGGLSLLETFSRNTVRDLRNAGYQTTPFFGRDVSRDELRSKLPDYDIFLWEGHHSTLVREFEFPTWDEPTPPALVFLQSCLALTEEKVQPVLRRGAVGVVGTSTRMYSASGGACSLAFFDALGYEGQSLGGSLRQAKNFLLAYTLLKEKRLGKGAVRTGANLRAAWAFTLWGDPTVKMPPPRREEADPPPRPFVRHEVRGDTIILSLPGGAHSRVETDKYQVTLPANGRMAGLLRKQRIDGRRPLVPFVFAEVRLPRGRAGLTPHLTSRLPSRRWVFCWDERRRCGYLLATPRPQDTGELRFHVRWEAVEADNGAPARAERAAGFIPAVKAGPPG